MNTNDEKAEMLQQLKEKWPSAWVARRDIGRFLGGALSPRTMSNLDSAGNGPKKIVMGRQVIYSVSDLLEWLSGRLEYFGGKRRQGGGDGR